MKEVPAKKKISVHFADNSIQGSILIFFVFSKNRPLADSFIESRCPSHVHFHVIFFACNQTGGCRAGREGGGGGFIFLDKSSNLFKIVPVLLSASLERFFVSRMRDFFVYI